MTAITSKSSVSVRLVGATIFVCSASLMALEIVAGRIMARYVGASIYTWTAAIAVVLAGLGVGNYLGGRLADRFPPRQTIGWLLATCSAACIASVALNNLAGEWTFLWGLGLPSRVVGHVTIAFSLPSILLGAVSPLAIRAALLQGLPKGRTVGEMYALGAAGSILGTFITGFWLIAAVGTVNVIWITAAAMLLAAIVFLPKTTAVHILALALLSLIAAGTAPVRFAERLGSAMSLRRQTSPDLLYETESQYSYIAVRRLSASPDERQFAMDNMKNHSRLIMGDIRQLRLPYTKVYAAVTRKAANNRSRLSTLSIGGGGYVFPRYIQDVWPGSRADVAEIDPAVTQAAIRAFGLPENAPIWTINLDGRNCIDGLLEKGRKDAQMPQYDFIYMDAFNNMSVPFQLVTREFNEKISAILAPDGLYLINLIDLFDNGTFLASLVSTIERTFPYVYVVTCRSRQDLPANFILVAAKRAVDLEGLEKDELLADTAVQIFSQADLTALKKRAGGIILADDYAPVENLMAPAALRAGVVTAANRYLDQARELSDAGRWEQAVAACKKAIKVCPARSLVGYNLMGRVLADRGKLKESAEAIASALAYGEGKESIATMAGLHYNIGVTLKRLGENADASRHLATAAQLLRAELTANPSSALTYSRLGEVLAASGDMNEAINCFAQALTKDPAETVNHLKLIEALAMMRRYDEATRRLNDGIEYMRQQGRNNDITQLQQLAERLKRQMTGEQQQ